MVVVTQTAPPPQQEKQEPAPAVPAEVQYDQGAPPDKAAEAEAGQ